MNTVDAAKTVERVVSSFRSAEQDSARRRLAKTLRYIISQRLIPRKNGSGRVAAVEIFKATPRTLGYIECGDGISHTLLEAIRNGAADGMQHFDHEIEKLVHAGVVDAEVAAAYSSNSQELRHSIAKAGS